MFSTRRSARPVERVSAATVVAERGADADALAKICGVLEPEESLRLVNSLAGVECLIVTADGQVAKSAGWHRLERPRPTLLAMAPQRDAASAKVKAADNAKTADKAKAEPKGAVAPGVEQGI